MGGVENELWQFYTQNLFQVDMNLGKQPGSSFS